MTQVELMVGLAVLSVAASGEGLLSASAQAAKPAAHNGLSPKGFVVKFASTESEGTDDDRHRSLQFFVDKKLDDTGVTVFEVYNGALRRLKANLVEEEPDRFSYRIRLPYRSPEGPNDIALILPAQPRSSSTSQIGSYSHSFTAHTLRRY